MDGSPSNKVIEKIKTFQDYHVKNYVFFVNVREAEYITDFKRKAKEQLNIDCVTLFLNNPNESIIRSNWSDSKAAKYEYDFYVSNDGTLEDLKDKAYWFLDTILKKE